MRNRVLSKAVAVVAMPESHEVRVWTEKRTLLLSPKEARGVAFALMVSADRAERRAIPNHKDNK